MQSCATEFQPIIFKTFIFKSIILITINYGCHVSLEAHIITIYIYICSLPDSSQQHFWCSSSHFAPIKTQIRTVAISWPPSELHVPTDYIWIFWWSGAYSFQKKKFNSQSRCNIFNLLFLHNAHFLCSKNGSSQLKDKDDINRFSRTPRSEENIHTGGGISKSSLHSTHHKECCNQLAPGFSAWGKGTQKSQTYSPEDQLQAWVT